MPRDPEELGADGTSVRLPPSEHARRWGRGDEEEDELSAQAHPQHLLPNSPPPPTPSAQAGLRQKPVGGFVWHHFN